MSIDSRYLKRAQEEEKSREFITETIFCGSCGYQLKMLPNVGRCPECGTPYNVLKYTKQGIFTPQTVQFPAFDLAAALGSTWLLIWLVAGLMRAFDFWALLLAATFAVLAPIFIKQAWRDMKRYWHGIKMTSQMEKEDSDG